MKVRINPVRCMFFLVVLVASAVFASFFGGPLPFLWLHAMLLLVPLSVAYTAWNFHSLRIYQEMDVHKVTRGEMHSYRAMLENTTILPIYRMRLFLLTDRCILEQLKDAQEITLQALEKREIASGIRCKFAGAYNIGIAAVALSDPFGIYQVQRPVEYTFRAVVKPPITDMANRALEIENRLNQLGLKSDQQLEPVGGIDVRSYQSGDPLHSIHWKLSAKEGNWMVRLPEKMEKRMVTILLQAAKTPEDSQDFVFLKKRDVFLEFIVSAAWHFGEQGMPVRLIYPFGQVTESIVNSRQTFQEFYDVLADGIFYGSEGAYEQIQRLAKERGMNSHEADTWIIIREHPQEREAFYTICN